jgi:hypothetical protein
MLLMLLFIPAGAAFNAFVRSTVLRRDLSMRVAPINRSVMRKIVPRQITIEQYGSYWGMNSIERVQKIFESVIVAYGGAWLAWVSSFVVGPYISAFIGVGLVFNWVYNPWLNAKKRNSKIWPKSMNLNYALFSGRIISLTRLRRRNGKMIGAVSQEYLQLVVSDEGDRRLEIITQWQDAYTELKPQMKCESIIASPDRKFDSLFTVTELWVPSCDCWVGDYPYLQRDRFERLVYKVEGRSMLNRDEDYEDSNYQDDQRVIVTKAVQQQLENSEVYISSRYRR